MGIRLDGAGDYLTHATARAGFNAEQSTWLIWLRRPSGVSWSEFARLLSVGEFDSTSGDGFDWDAESDGTSLNGQVWDGGTNNVVGNSVATTDDTWHALVIRSDQSAGGPSNQAQKDGVSVGTTTDTRGTASVTVTIGARNSDPAQNQMQVDVAEVAVWDTYLTDQQIQDLYDGGSGGNGVSPSDIASSNLISHWRLTDTSDLADQTSNGFDLTSNGDPANTGHPPVDAPASGGTTARTISDGITLGDDVGANAEASLSDGLVLGDDATIPDDAVSASDGIILGDEAGANAEVSLTDGIQFGEDFDIAWVTDSGPDGIVLGDAVGANAEVAPSDGIVLGDTASEAGTVTASVSDGLVLSDSPADAFTARPSLSDGVVFGDTPSPATTDRPSLTDGLTLGDSVADVFTARPSVTDGIVFGDSLSENLIGAQIDLKPPFRASWNDPKRNADWE